MRKGKKRLCVFATPKSLTTHDPLPRQAQDTTICQDRLRTKMRERKVSKTKRVVRAQERRDARHWLQAEAPTGLSAHAERPFKGGSRGLHHGAENATFCAIYIKCIILPRQARDKIGKTQKRVVFFAARGCVSLFVFRNTTTIDQDRLGTDVRKESKRERFFAQVIEGLRCGWWSRALSTSNAAPAMSARHSESCAR